MAVGKINKDIIVLDKSDISMQINAGVTATKTLSSWGITIPNGYKILSVTPIITGANVTADGNAFAFGYNGILVDANVGVAVQNRGTQQRTWTMRIIVVCGKI